MLMSMTLMVIDVGKSKRQSTVQEVPLLEPNRFYLGFYDVSIKDFLQLDSLLRFTRVQPCR